MSPSKKSRKSEVMGNHQRSWIWGRHAVVEALRSPRWTPLEIAGDERLDRSSRSEVEQLATDRGIAIDWVSSERLQQLCKQRDHQGLIARLPAFPYESESTLPEIATGSPLLVVLDSIQDAFNFGSILRCAEVFGASAAIVGSKHQSEVTSQVVRSSAGAVYHIPIVRCDDLTRGLQTLKTHGVRLVAASEKAKRPLPQSNLVGSVALVIGNEGSGIAAERLALCDETVTIPQSGKIDSLNAAVSAGIFLYEALRQRSKRETTTVHQDHPGSHATRTP